MLKATVLDFQQVEHRWTGLSDRERVDDARSMDLEALARDTDTPLEELFYPLPDGEVGEPEPNLAVIGNLLQQLMNEEHPDY